MLEAEGKDTETGNIFFLGKTSRDEMATKKNCHFRIFVTKRSQDKKRTAVEITMVSKGKIHTLMAWT